MNKRIKFMYFSTVRIGRFHPIQKPYQSKYLIPCISLEVFLYRYNTTK